MMNMNMNMTVNKYDNEYDNEYHIYQTTIIFSTDRTKYLDKQSITCKNWMLY